MTDLMKELERKKLKPPKSSTKLSLVAADFVFFLLDVGSGAGVWYITETWYYGLLVIVAGIAPLLLWQKQLVQPMASEEQREIAKYGIYLSICSVVVVALMIGVVRFLTNSAYTEIGLAVVLVLLAAVHGVLSFRYFMISDEFTDRQDEAQVVGEALRRIRRYQVTETVLDATQRAVDERKRVEGKYSPEEVGAALKEENLPNASRGERPR